jgi:ketosteroid isomerase-like protein
VCGGAYAWPDAILGLVASQNVELVRSIVAAWEMGEYGSAEWAHPDIDFIRADGPEPGTWTGLDGLAEGTRYRLNAWEEFRIEAAECRELDDGRVLLLGHARARGKSSGLEVLQRQAMLFHIRDGRVTRLVTTSTTSARWPTSASLRRATLRDGLGER